MLSTIERRNRKDIGDKILSLNWPLIFLITLLACVGFLALYSAGGGNFSPWASRQMTRFIIGFSAMIIVALINIRVWYKLAWPLYFGTLFLLILVELMGHVGMGAQRWINLGFIKLQPSEVMKIAVIIVLAKYFHMASPGEIKKLKFLILPAIIVIAPIGLVLLQPDLGTSLMIIMASAAVFFMAGLPVWFFGTAAALAVASIPIAWHFMHSYQKQRVLTFLNPESDPLGSGYHIMQSKIALGSGGVEGKGFLKGTQSHLNFLPEKQTDFIFTLWAEEWGLTGGLFLLALFGLIFLYGLFISLSCKHNFGRYLALGLSVNFSLYVVINIAMVMGLIPVVGAPLPLVSYGGTVILTTMIGFGLMMCCSIHKDSKI